MKLKLLLAVLLTINCFSQSNVINDGSWFLIQINKGDEVINFPVDINVNPIFT